MISEQILHALIEANLAASAAIVLMLILRPMLGRIFGARAVYRLWLIVPITALAISLPAPQPANRTIAANTALVGEQFATSAGDSLSGLVSAKTHSAIATVTTWVVNTRSEVRSTAYDSATLLFALWMAGAVLLLARAFILSHKLAADTLLGPALVGVLRPRLVLPNDFTTRFDAREHGRGRSAAAVLVIATLMGGSGYVAWAAQPTDPGAGAASDALRPRSVPPAQPPAGLLTELEQKRHALFLKQAEAGNIDMVYIGDSVVDFWRYDNSGNPGWNTHSGGKAEGNRSYVPLKAANFGVEGAHTRSVLWRLQHGELDNIQPKVVVLVALGIADSANHHIEVPQIIAGNKAIIAEIRKRQPQARILLIALPRGQPTNLSRQVMAPVNDTLAKFADNQWIYFLDLNGRFLAPDGTLDRALYADDLGQVLSPKGYVAWSEAMQPMLAKLMR